MNRLVVIMAALLAACSGGRQVTVKVENGLSIPRENETVEVAWDSLQSRINGLTADNVVVINSQGDQIPSQVIYAGDTIPQTLIFQTTVGADSTCQVTVTTGVRNAYKTRVFGRFVPERLDDYAWENNCAAFRLYGPALAASMVSSGIDYWAKSTPNLVIDDWYEKNISGKINYHIDLGEGCDCYDVGPTLGMGASAPYADGKLWFSSNFVKAETLDNGPIRTTAKIAYAPFDVNGRQISLVKIVSLDAYSHFNRMTDLYAGEGDTLSVAAGMVMHQGAQLFPGEGTFALYEPASFSPSGNDGPLGGGVVLPGGKAMQIDNEAVCVATAQIGKPFVYYSGAGTSKQGITAEQWAQMVSDEYQRVTNPLKVSIE